MPESITHWVPELKEERILRVPKAGADERIGGGGSVFDRELSSFGREDTSSQDEDFEDPEDFRIPEESKRVVTASGKIIESDTEELKKKVESRRKEVREEHGDRRPWGGGPDQRAGDGEKGVPVPSGDPVKEGE